jgi:hypothetical protein
MVIFNQRYFFKNNSLVTGPPPGFKGKNIDIEPGKSIVEP